MRPRSLPGWGQSAMINWSSRAKDVVGRYQLLLGPLVEPSGQPE